MPTRLRAAVVAAALTLNSALTLAGLALITGPTPAAAAPPTCASVGIFGVRGSGQTSGFGPEVSATVRSLERGLRNSGRTYAEFPLSYTSASTDLIIPTKPHPQGYPWDVARYVASVGDGTSALYTTLDLRSRTCPDETPALIGYSQGAMVVRNVMQTLARNGQTALLKRIGAVGLIADPDKQPNEPNIGDAPAFSIGVASFFHAGGPVSVPSAVLGRAMNACRSQDIACDLSFHGSATVHTTYTQTNFPGRLGTWLVKPTVARSAAPPPAPSSNGSVVIGWSAAHPNWITMTTSGFGAGNWQFTCNLGNGIPQTYSVVLTADRHTFDNGHTCYDATPGDPVWVVIGSATSNTITVGPRPPARTCSYSDAGNGRLITVPTGSTFTDSRGLSYRVNTDCSLTQVCSYTDAANGQLITVPTRSTFSDSRGLRYFVNDDCSLTPA